MTPRSKPRYLLLLLLAVVLAGSGCASIKKMWKNEDKNEGQPVEVLYDRAHDNMRQERWAGATEVFQRLIAQYPYGPYTEQALMEMAYAQFKAGKHDDAVSTIDRFIRTYPTHRNIAYFYYLRGLSNATRNAIFLQRVFSLEMSNRDLSTPMQAYNDFSIVVERYPNSRYAEDAG
jgi:outer membrane protein assembly factor BamD